MCFSTILTISIFKPNTTHWASTIRLVLFFTCLIWIQPTLLSAQLPESKKALLRIFNDSKQADTLRLKAGIALQVLYRMANTDSLQYISRQMELYGKKEKQPLWQAYSWIGYGRVHLVQGQPDSAGYAFQKAQKLYPKRDNALYCHYLMNMGNLQMVTGQRDEAESTYQKAILEAERVREPRLLSYIYLNLGGVHANKRNYAQAFQAFEKAKRTAGLDVRIIIEQNLCIIFRNLQMKDQAEKHARTQLSLAQKAKAPILIANAYSALVSVSQDSAGLQDLVEKALRAAKKVGSMTGYFSILEDAGGRFSLAKRLDLAEYYTEQAVELAKKIEDPADEVSAKIILASVHVQQKKYHSALKLCREIRSLMQIKGANHVDDFHMAISGAFAGLGRMDSAYLYLKKVDSRRAIGSDREIILSYLDYQQKQEKETLAKEKAAAEALTKEVQKRQRTTVGIFALLSLFLVSIAGAFYVFFRQRSRTAAQLSAQNAALQRSNERLRRFSGVISHDILSNLDLLLTAGHVLVGEQPKKESLTQYYDIAQRTSRQLKDYCLGLLEEARSTVGIAGKMSDPMPIVEGILARQEIALLNKACKVQVEALAPTLLPLSIVEQVFQNLVSNAIRYGLDAPEPLLRIAEEQDSLHGTTRWVVEDNGSGVSPALHEAIFEKTPTEELQSQGQDLGLRLLRETLKSYGAKIWVEDRVGGGAKFVVDLGMREELQG